LKIKYHVNFGQKHSEIHISVFSLNEHHDIFGELNIRRFGTGPEVMETMYILLRLTRVSLCLIFVTFKN